MSSADLKPGAAEALPLSIVVMGVCGVGKSRVASGLAAKLHARFIEADDFHSPENKRLMSKGMALSDEQRAPWLDAVASAALDPVGSAGGSVVIACSALRKVHRDRLRASLKTAFFIHLAGDRDLIAERLNARRDHFVGTALLESQLQILEPLSVGESGVTLDIVDPAGVVVDRGLQAFEEYRSGMIAELETRSEGDAGGRNGGA